VIAPLRLVAEQAFSRPAGAPLVQENRIRILKIGQGNYPAWLDALGAAMKTVHFESYIINADDIGYRFADLLCTNARKVLPAERRDRKVSGAGVEPGKRRTDRHWNGVLRNPGELVCSHCRFSHGSHGERRGFQLEGPFREGVSDQQPSSTRIRRPFKDLQASFLGHPRALRQMQETAAIRQQNRHFPACLRGKCDSSTVFFISISWLCGRQP